MNSFPHFLRSATAGIFLSACLPSFASDYSWNNAGVSASAGTWNLGTNWSPNSPAGGPTSADNIIAPTLTGNINVNIANAQVANWTHDINSNFLVFSDGAAASTLTIGGTLGKSGTGTLTFRNSTQLMNLVAEDILVSQGTLAFGGSVASNQALNSLTVNDSFEVTGGTVNFQVGAGNGTLPGTAAIGGLFTVGTGALVNLRGQGISAGNSATTTVSANGLSGGGTIQVNSNSTTGHAAVLSFTNNSGSATFSGIVRNGSGAAPNVLSVTKSGAGTQVLSGNSNNYGGGTTVSAGSLLVTNTSGSGTGTGAVSVQGGTFGGTGFVAPTGANGLAVAAGGFLAPGAGNIGTLTINLGATTGGLNLSAGGDFQFELGAANLSIGGIAPASSDLLVLSGISASDVAFGGGNSIDLLGTATGAGYYLLFDTSLNQTTWTGLTLGAAVTGGNLITGGLTATNFGGGLTGNLILGDGSAGTGSGDIYLQVVPEPSTWALVVCALGILFFRRRGPLAGCGYVC